MGNSTSATPSQEEQISADLLILGDGSTTQIDRQEPFQRLREHFAPVTNQSQSYADELRRVFGLRFERWAVEGQTEDAVTRVLLANRVRGCVYGAALGDAVGLATEFLSKQQVGEHYSAEQDWTPGQEGMFCDTHRMGFPRGDWTDDTDQMVLVLHSLLETGGVADATDFGAKLSGWMARGFPGLGDQGAAGLGKSTKAVLRHPGFESDPVSAAEEVWRKAGCKVAPNGAVMRTAVCGIPYFWDRKRVRQNASLLCRATHADPRCIASCDVVSTVVSEMLCAVAAQSTVGEDALEEMIRAAVGEAKSLLSDQDHLDDFEQHAAKASLEELELADPHAIGYTFKCTFAALQTLRIGAASRDFKSAMIELMMHGGDADTNGAVAGALLGCHLGYEALPAKWLAAMPYAGWLEAWVQKLLFMLELPIVDC